MNITEARVFLKKAWGSLAVSAMTDDEVLYEAARVKRLNGRDEDNYRKAYRRGWRTSERVGNLDRADADGRSDDDAWMDGYLDYAAGREEWHLLFCPDHDSCP